LPGRYRNTPHRRNTSLQAARQRQQATFEARLDKIVSTYANRSALLRCLREVRLA
jgi:hypothetical protein